ncbi:hypothetical protein [Tuwongella immobilis]|uniref:Uncharacterized protein n=1 Tax=Tuwongella immobilis TaxID=692036 RepID=A0A6C2YIM1_9BACT|nr:hypothetical protein [Tuwongella immobilis]VIP00832.1 unnamed protein product [Tuwongella immobilis]VTR97082.1 unnamed protein product [Tuwongella immobilis]
MNLTDHSLFDYLHDAEVTSVVWDNTNPRQRRLQLIVTVVQDIEHLPWRGQSLAVTMLDVVLFRLVGYGHQVGLNWIDSIRTEVSKGFEEECQQFKANGISIPPLRFTIVFTDGSTLELTCASVDVEEIGSASPQEMRFSAETKPTSTAQSKSRLWNSCSNDRP